MPRLIAEAKLIMANIGTKLKSLIFYFFAWIAKIFYLLYLATIEPKAVIVNWGYHPYKLPLNFNAVYVFWHSKTFMIMPMGRNSRIAVLTLLDWKNFFYGKLCKVFGYRTIPVTSDACAARSLKRAIDDGYSIALAVDGPRGPLGVIRPGAIYLARKTKRPIITINIKAGKSVRLENRWDRYEIPIPFTRTTIIIGDPVYAGGKSIEAVKAELKMRLGDC